MKRKLLFLFLLYSTFISTYSQVKIGDNPSQIHSSSILELESSDKVLIISRMTTAQIASIVDPQAGSLVYNTEQNCVFMHDGTSWRSLCNSISGINVTTNSTAPTNPNLGDFWINNAQNNATHIWNGSQWTLINNNPTRGNGAPTASTAPSPSAGDVYVDSTTGVMYAYDGTTWVQQAGGNVNANNGLLVSPTNTVQLGGALIQPTIITTDATNTLAITGLEDGNTTEDDIVTINRTTGQLRKISATNLLREEVTELVANDGQRVFNGLTLRSTDKVNVYRNGVRIDFTILNNTTIEIEMEATCYAGDAIRIVQFY